MQVTVLAFGIAKEMMGDASFNLEVEEGVDITRFRKILEEKFPKIKGLDAVMIAVNNEYADATDRLAAGDEVAIIPPVSGG
jgi:molybdopterin synthase sulfur carrier subunit